MKALPCIRVLKHVLIALALLVFVSMPMLIFRTSWTGENCRLSICKPRTRICKKPSRP